MAPEINPESLRNARFRTTLRGADTSEVGELLSAAASVLEQLQADRDRLAAKLGEFADRDLKTEFEKVGSEVTEVLETARLAAATMRERASADAARWRSEAMAETEQLRKEARNDAEALRGDAWTTGSDLLAQVVAEVRRLTEQAERDTITITGEAEREAHRLVSTARREAEDLLRSATMDAEKMSADAVKARDSMIEEAHRQAEASQQRTGALEQRREELMKELDAVRATLGQLEGTLEAKREDLNLSRTSESSVKVVPTRPRPPEPAVETWRPGETVRVIRPSDEEPPVLESPPATAEPMLEAPEMAESPPVEDEPEVVETEADAVSNKEPHPDATSVPEPRLEPASSDDVGALFASLRSPDETNPQGLETGIAESPQSAPAAPPQPATKPDMPPVTAAAAMRADDDLLEGRDSALLPITNRALRGIKRAVTEAQNIALDSLRTDSTWSPDENAITEILRADLIGLWAESYAAGHHMAEALTGSKLKRPETPPTDSATEFGSDLAAALAKELSSSGGGQRERQSAASRVFRGWRTDESERRVRELSLRGYHLGLVQAVGGSAVIWVPSGTPCSSCREAAKDPTSHLPPVHHGCECGLTVS